MRRSSCLLVATLVLMVASSASAQEVIPPYAEEPTPHAGPTIVPAPPPAQAAVPPPVVVPPPPQGYYQQPYYYYAQPQPAYAPPPPRLFHEEVQPRYGLMVAGLVVFGASWSVNAATAILADEWKLAVPVVGPFLETQNVYTGPGYEVNRMLVGLLIFDGLIETAGAVMFLAGVLTHHKVRVYDRAQVSVVPTGGPGSAGLAAFGSF